MNPELLSILTQAPFAIVILVAAYYIFRENTRTTESWRTVLEQTTKENNDTLRDVARSHHEALSELVDANNKAMQNLGSDLSERIEKNNELLAKNTAVILLATSKGIDPNNLTEELVHKLLNGGNK